MVQELELILHLLLQAFLEVCWSCFPFYLVDIRLAVSSVGCSRNLGSAGFGLNQEGSVF